MRYMVFSNLMSCILPMKTYVILAVPPYLPMKPVDRSRARAHFHEASGIIATGIVN